MGQPARVDEARYADWYQYRQPLPIWVGGQSRAALRRTAQFATGWHPIDQSPAQLQTAMAPLATPRQLSGLYGIVEDDADRLALPGAHPAHTMAQVDTIPAFRALHWPMMHREDDAVSLAERHYLSARLHTRSLLREHEFAAREVVPRHR